MPSEHYNPGHPCYCDVLICNPSPNTYPAVPVFVVLDVYGEYYFAPEFSDFDYYLRDITPGESLINVLTEFEWPDGAGSASGIRFHAAMTDQAMSELFGAMDTFEFGWSE